MFSRRFLPKSSAAAAAAAAAAVRHGNKHQYRCCRPVRSLTTAAMNMNRYRSDQNKDKPGLFSIPGLHTPADFRRLTKEAMLKSDDLREGIPVDTQHLTSKSHAIDTLYQLDQISKTICNVIDAAELCRSAHASQEWREVANETFQQLQQYIGALNADRRLYHALGMVEDQYGDELTEEEARFCFLLQREFELDGIHLADEQREKVQVLHEHVVTLETLWMTNITNSHKQYWLDENAATVVEQILPRHVLEANGAVYDDTGSGTSTSSSSSSRLQIVADSPIAHSISSFSPNGDLRKQVHWESMTQTPENKEVLDALIRQRQQLATGALGFESYAARSLQDKMAHSPAGVLSFLKDVERQIQPQYKADLELLSRAKSQVEGGGSTTTKMEAWDVKFYTKLLKAQMGVDPNELAPYLGLENCLNAMQVLVDRLFGIDMKEQPMAPGESWDVQTDDDNNNNNNARPAAEERIRKFAFWDQQTQQPLGTMYLDLHPRPGKYTHAAHFTVRCGCRSSGADSDYQLPIVALVCNMNAGSATLSSHAEVETLFHEMGHALHSLLSRTNFQHMAGTRAAMDFVETPSHWMEHFVWDFDFLQILCQHKQTGETLPDETIRALVASRNQFKCLEMQNQIVLSRFDQEIFGASTGPSSVRPQELWTQLHKDYQVPFMEGSHFYTNVGHFVTYGAGYYGYLYSQVFASAIWNELFVGTNKSSLNREAGRKLWKGMLIHGGARDPQVMLHDLLGGKKPTVENYWTTLSSSSSSNR
jgi:intermediate peptidase